MKELLRILIDEYEKVQKKLLLDGDVEFLCQINKLELLKDIYLGCQKHKLLTSEEDDQIYALNNEVNKMAKNLYEKNTSK
jgi:hypothetical protein